MHIVLLYTPDFPPAAHCVPTVRAYAARHGYLLTEHTQLLRPEWVPAWNKLCAVQRAQAEARSEWVVWLDADVEIRNPALRLESLFETHAELVCSTDYAGPCFGFFGVRDTAAIAELFRRAALRYTTDWPWEQGVLKTLLAEPEFAPLLGLIPESSISNTGTKEPSPLALAHHYWHSPLVAHADPNIRRLARFA